MRPSDDREAIALAVRGIAPNHWVFGVFDRKRELAKLILSDARFDVRRALDLLFVNGARRGDPGAVQVLRTDAHALDLRSVLGATYSHSDGRLAKLLLVRTTRDFTDEEVDQLRMRSTEIAQLLERTGASQFEVSRNRRPPHVAVFSVGRDLRVIARWLLDDERLRDLAAAIEPRAGRLPAFLEQSVAEATASWDWNDPAKCSERSATPIPGLYVRVLPAVAAEGLRALLIVETVQTRYTLDAAMEHFGISSREAQVLRLLLEGYHVSEVAELLSIADSTVQDHVKHIISKTDSRNRVQMAAKILGWSVNREERRKSSTGHA